MHQLIKKIHMYLGLLSFTILLIFGIIGLMGLTLPAPPQRARPQPQVRHQDFQVPPNLTDKELVDHARRALRPPLASPMGAGTGQRDPDQNLVFAMHSPNGPWRITVLEKENRLRIETRRSWWWQYLNALHTMTIRAQTPDCCCNVKMSH